MATLILYSTKDTAPNSDQGSSPNGYQNGLLSVVDYPGSLKVRPYIGFDVSSLPASAVVSSATLNCYMDPGGGGTTTAGVYQVDGPWEETTLHWNNQPAVSTHFGDFYNPNNPMWQSVVVTSAIAPMKTGTAHGFSIRKTVSDYAYLRVHARESAYDPYLSITYTIPPTAPGAITSPANGSVHDASIALSAGQATDADTAQGSLQYEWSYSANGGTSWMVISGLTAAGTTAKAWNTSALAEGTNYKVRVRAYDGTSYGPYTTQTGTFSIAHGSRVKRWSGTAWELKLLKRWNGSAWVNTKLKRWNGSAWITE